MKVLLTGGAGYIGSVVTRLMLRSGHQPVVLDDCSTGHADSVPAGVELIRAELPAADEILARGGFAAVMHLAGKSLVAESVRDPAGYWRANLCGTRDLLDAVARNHVPRFVFSSSAAVYGEPANVPITELGPTQPTNPYGATKLAVDAMLGDEAAATGLAAVSLRYFNVAGAAFGAGERHDPETHLIPLALAATAQRPLRIFGADWPTPDGTCIRDYVHVADVARAHLLAATAARPGEHLVCNLGSTTGYSVREVLTTIANVTGRDVPAEIGPRRPGDPARLVASAGRASERLGWHVELDLAAMVRDAWEFANGAPARA